MNPQPPAAPARLVSGGQTGVDRGALEAAIACGVPHGGWCPAGRRAENGRIPERFALVETASDDYAVRTEANVRDSDATLILCRGGPSGGTLLTAQSAERCGRPLLVLPLDEPVPADRVRRWVADHAVRVLNVAGPRESDCPGAETAAFARVCEVFAACGLPSAPPRG